MLIQDFETKKTNYHSIKSYFNLFTFIKIVQNFTKI